MSAYRFLLFSYLLPLAAAVVVVTGITLTFTAFIDVIRQVSRQPGSYRQMTTDKQPAALTDG